MSCVDRFSGRVPYAAVLKEPCVSVDFLSCRTVFYTRKRMEQVERQLASLTGLVQTALTGAVGVHGPARSDNGPESSASSALGLSTDGGRWFDNHVYDNESFLSTFPFIVHHSMPTVVVPNRSDVDSLCLCHCLLSNWRIFNLLRLDTLRTKRMATYIWINHEGEIKKSSLTMQR